MNANTILQKLRWHLLVCGACFLIAAAIVYGMKQYGQTATRQAQQAAAEAKQMQNKAQRLRSEEQDIRDKIARYKALEAQGIIGAERRLDWVELLRAIQNERKLIDLDYEFSPQMLISPGALPKPANGHDFYTSQMRLRLPLLHEDDLIGTLKDLSTRASALIRVRECKLRRSTTTANDTPTGLSPQIEAECMLDWITVRTKGNAGGTQ